MLWIAVAAAYIIGSIPTGVIVARLHGVDLRSQGSGNIGATNALRVIGRKAGAMTLAGDLLKGILAVYLAVRLAGHDAGLLAAAAAVVGHDFSLFMGFKGGKGVATTFGAFVAVEPLVALIAFMVWLATVIVWRYSSLGAIVSFSLLPVMVMLFGAHDRGLVLLSLFMTGLALIKHRSNIARLLKGTEPRIGARAV